MLKKYIIIFYSSILYRCMYHIQGTLSTPRLSTSSKKGIKSGRVQIDRNPFDRLLPFSPFPLVRAFWEFSQWSIPSIDINRTPVSKTRPLSSYQLTHDKVMPAWTSDIHAAARQEPTGGPVFILCSTQSSSYIYRYTVLIRY